MVLQQFMVLQHTCNARHMDVRCVPLVVQAARPMLPADCATVKRMAGVSMTMALAAVPRARVSVMTTCVPWRTVGCL